MRQWGRRVVASTSARLGWTRTIRVRLVLLALACMVPAAAMMSLLIGLQWQEGQRQSRANLILTARALVNSLDNDFSGVQAGLKLLAGSADFAGPQTALRAQATVARDALGLDNITLNDVQGQQLMNLRLPPGSPLPRHADAVQIAAVAHQQGPTLSNLYLGSVSGKHLVGVYEPVVQQGTITAVLSGTIDTARLARVFLNQSLPPSWIGAVYDSSGTIVARTHEPERFVGRKPRPETLAAIVRAPEGVFDGITVKGTPVESAYSRSQQSGWTVIIGIPKEELAQELRQTIATLTAATLLLLGASVALALLIGSRIAGSVHRLVDAATALGEGQPPAVERLFFREAQEVGTAMSAASEVLSHAAGALAASESRLRTILETAQDAVIVADRLGRVVFFNAQATRMFGRPADEALGAPLAEFIAADCMMERDGAAQLCPRKDGTVVGRRAEGEPFPVEASVSSTQAGGEVLTTLVLRDVTERIRSQEALVRSNLDLQQFAYVASHDLKNPLRSIAGLVELMQRDYAPRLDERALNVLSRTAKAVRTLEVLTDDLLAYARLNTGDRPLAPVDCAELVQEVLHLLAAPVAKSGARVDCQGLPVVMGHRTQLAQLFLNLLGNALKYRGAAVPAITVSARWSHDAWLFEVADNGIGIAAQYHERVFEIFKRLHTAAEYEGSGIGLSLCRRVVQNHGGSIWIESAPEAGCTIRFIIPDRRHA